MRRYALLLASGLLAATPGQTLAQPTVPHSAVRAINLARNTAIQLNGGLSVYRPAQCMFQTGDTDNPCLVARNSDGFTFRFLGGGPGWQVLSEPANRETEIQISADGRTVKQVIYNGAPR